MRLFSLSPYLFLPLRCSLSSRSLPAAHNAGARGHARVTNRKGKKARGGVGERSSQSASTVAQARARGCRRSELCRASVAASGRAHTTAGGASNMWRPAERASAVTARGTSEPTAAGGASGGERGSSVLLHDDVTARAASVLRHEDAGAVEMETSRFFPMPFLLFLRALNRMRTSFLEEETVSPSCTLSPH